MTARVPDHAALPVEQLRALLAIPPEWPDCRECDHCGDIAIYADAAGLYWDGEGEECLSCGFPGRVCVDGDECDDQKNTAAWRTGEEPEDRCNELGCTECTATVAQ